MTMSHFVGSLVVRHHSALPSSENPWLSKVKPRISPNIALHSSAVVTNSVFLISDFPFQSSSFSPQIIFKEKRDRVSRSEQWRQVVEWTTSQILFAMATFSGEVDSHLGLWFWIWIKFMCMCTHTYTHKNETDKGGGQERNTETQKTERLVSDLVFVCFRYQQWMQWLPMEVQRPEWCRLDLSIQAVREGFWVVFSLCLSAPPCRGALRKVLVPIFQWVSSSLPFILFFHQLLFFSPNSVSVFCSNRCG